MSLPGFFSNASRFRTSPIFSFGEKLPVVTHTPTDPDLPGFYYENIAGLLDGQFSEEAILSACGIAKESRSDASRNSDVSRIIKYAPAELIGREAETKLLSDAWDQAVRGEPKRPHVLTFVALGGEGKTSLVAKWAAELAHQGWPGCDAVFAWSFYSQGTREQTAVSSDAFLAEALGFFGDAATAGSAQGAFDKGRRLARLVGERRALLILDGLEPLQYAPRSPTPGKLKDQGITELLKGLAATSLGLCVVTTRYAIPDLRAFWQTTAPMHELPRLSTAAGVKLLRTIGVKTGSQADFEKLVEDVDGHALTLQILGQFLVRAFHGDIRRRDRISFEKADAKIQGGHAFRAMEAYVKWLEDDSEEARREVALLKLLGLFDRPATADCVAALRQAPAIPGLTEPLVGLAEDDWEFSLSRLARREAAHGEPGGRFRRARRPRRASALAGILRHAATRGSSPRPGAPRTGGSTSTSARPRRKATSPPSKTSNRSTKPWPTAARRGCSRRRVTRFIRTASARGNEAYSTKKLGAFGSDLGAVACFFETPWSRVSPALTEADQAWLLNEAAFCLRALGRLTEALEPMRAGLEMRVKQEDWKNAAIDRQQPERAGADAGRGGRGGGGRRAVRDATPTAAAMRFSGCVKRTTLADALHQAGRRAEAEARFREAEQMQAERQPDYPLLYSLQGFRYCDLLLAEAERAAWQVSCSGGLRPPEDGDAHRATLQAVSERAAQTLKWAEHNQRSLLDIALDHLTLGRAALYAAILEGSSLDPCRAPLQHAVDGLRRAGAARPPSPRPPHPRLAAVSRRQTHRPRERAERPGRGLGDRRARPHETPHGRHPPPPRPALLPRSAVSLGIPRRRSRRRARAHREMRLRAAQGGAGGCRAGDWRGRSLTPSLPPPS